MLFITPRVVENATDVDTVINDLRRRMDSIDEYFPGGNKASGFYPAGDSTNLPIKATAGPAAAVAPTPPTQTPAPVAPVPVVAPSAPVVAPSAPVVAPSAPVVAPSAPVVDTTVPAVQAPTPPPLDAPATPASQ